MSDFANDVYVRRLLPKGHGYPVYGPKPDDNLPQEYRDRGTSIGDLVLITADGTIDFLFNICLPADHPVNDGRTPQCFEMVDLVASIDLSSMENWHAAGSTIASSSVKKKSLSAGAVVTAPGTDASGGASFKFTSSSSEFAILHLQDGADCQNLRHLKKFREQALKHAKNWYDHANDTLGRDASYNSLYLVTGCDKSESWGIASYSDESEDIDVCLDLTAAPIVGAHGSFTYSWATDSPATVRVGPDRFGRGQPGKKNQCVFIRGFKIAIREGPWAKIFGPVHLASIREANAAKFFSDKGGAFTFKRRASPSSFSTNSNENTSSSGSRRRSFSSDENSEFDENDAIFDNDFIASDDETTDDDVSVNHFPGPSEPYHPASVINDCLLDAFPDIDVVVTHDDAWCTILKNEDIEFPNDEELLRRINHEYRVVTDAGSAFLVSSSDPENVALYMNASPLVPILDDDHFGLYSGTTDMQQSVQNLDLRTTHFSQMQYHTDVTDDAISALAVLRPVNRSAYYMQPCTLGTRQWRVDKINRWLEDTEASNSIWLSGPAGFGKSVMGNLICRELGAASFYMRGDTALSNLATVRRTVAYDLAQKNADIADRIENLMIRPKNTSDKPQAIILVDALDEYGSDIFQTFIDTLKQWLRPTSELFITSRDQGIPTEFRKLCYHIPRALATKDLVSVEVNIGLQSFLQQHFASIASSHLVISYPSLPPSWPDELEMEELVGRANGLLFWPDSVDRILGREKGDPIDELYSQVLHQSFGHHSNHSNRVLELILLCPKDLHSRIRNADSQCNICQTETSHLPNGKLDVPTYHLRHTTLDVEILQATKDAQMVSWLDALSLLEKVKIASPRLIGEWSRTYDEEILTFPLDAGQFISASSAIILRSFPFLDYSSFLSFVSIKPMSSLPSGLLHGYTVKHDSDLDGRTPLSWAAHLGHKEVVKSLLSRTDIEVNSKNDSDLGRRPLSLAAARRQVVRRFFIIKDIELGSMGRLKSEPAPSNSPCSFGVSGEDIYCMVDKMEARGRGDTE